MKGLLLLGWLTAVSPPVDDATLAFFNARLALQEGRPEEALRLWFVRNTVLSQRDLRSPWDGDMRSVAWAAMSELGTCSDRFDRDDSGARLWPVALHDWFIRTRRRSSAPDRPGPFGAFKIGRQRRDVGLGDVLDAGELSTLRFHRTDCTRRQLLLRYAEALGLDPRGKRAGLKVLEKLLRAALTTVDFGKVDGRSVIEARLFDIPLALAELNGETTRRAVRSQRRQGRLLGVPLPDVEPQPAADPELISITEKWSPADWMALSAERRLFIYQRVRSSTPDRKSGPLELEIIDRLLDAGAGGELEAWIAYIDAADRGAVWSEGRGKSLLSLGDSTGFRERSAIALHRGVHYLAKGEVDDALRSFGLVLHHAHRSRSSEEIRSLGLRWVSYVVGRYGASEELLATLVALVPRGDLAPILEDLLWEAALVADGASFRRLQQTQRGRGALRRRVQRLEPLAQGQADRFLAKTRVELREQPNTGLRFLERLLDRLERQPMSTRRRSALTLRAIQSALRMPSLVGGKVRKSLVRRARDLDARIGAVLDGLPEGPAAGGSYLDRARGYAPGGEVFAGTIRLAPTDPLPWPFRQPPPTKAPSIWTPIRMTPVQRSGPPKTVFGWRLGG